MSQSRLLVLILMLSFLTALAGCGQTGDLYLPEDTPKEKAQHQSSS
ncbi:MAG: lipoprotein [Gammaproteobacteria bacterium]|nr:lipoprotein [Gammaproteobacteria bacterium]